jgi:hypothetical protein
MEKLDSNDQCQLVAEGTVQNRMFFQYEFIWHTYVGSGMLREQLQRRWKIILCGALVLFFFVSISIFQPFKSHRTIYKDKEFASLKFYRSKSGSFSSTKQFNNGYGYPVELVEDLVRDKEISFVFPVHQGDRGLLVNLLRSMRNLCMGCTEVPIIVVTDDASKESIFKILYNETSPWPGEAVISQSFPHLSIKLLREVMPYYTVNKWNDESFLKNGKYLIQSHKKLFGILNGASTRFVWVMDVDSFIFKPISLRKMLKEYLSLPYIFTTHDWTPGRDITDCPPNITRNFQSTGYSLEVMHWIYDREIVSDLNDLVLTQFSNWNVPIIMTNRYFFELLYYHFIMSNQIQYRQYMQYKIIEIRTLLGGNESPLLQAIARTAMGGLIENIGVSVTKTPSIYRQIAQMWKELKIFCFRPQGSQLVSLDFALDTEVVIMTNYYVEELYRMSQSGYWKNATFALNNAEKQGWKALAEYIKQRNNQMQTSTQKPLRL